MRFVTRLGPIASVLGVVGAVIVYGCGSATDVDTRSPCADPAPLTAHVGPLEPSVSVGNRVQLNVLLRCGADGPTVSTTWKWNSSNPDVISVDAGGLATGVSRGTATVTATSVRFPVATASVAVRAIVFSSFVPSIQPPALVMAPGVVAQFRATVSEEPNAPIVWSIDQPDIATVDATGLVRAPRCGVLGAAVVTARNAADPTLSASAALIVRDPGAGHLALQFINDSISNEPADVGHVRGTIAIRVNLDDRLVECGGVGGIEVVVKSSGRDDVVLVAKLPTYPETTTDVYCNTTARAPSGQPQTPNGSYSITARAFDPKATLIEETGAVGVTVDNP